MNNSNTVWILSQVRRVISVFVLLAAAHRRTQTGIF